MGAVMLDGTIKLPGVGEVPKRHAAIAAAAAAGIVVFAYIRRARSSEPVYDPATGAPIDDGIYDNPAPGQGTEFDPFWTVAEWTEDVVAKLAESGYEPSWVVMVLGRWLDGQSLTSEEADLVRAALALRGAPPGGPYPIVTGSPSRTEETDPGRHPWPELEDAPSFPGDASPVPRNLPRPAPESVPMPGPSRSRTYVTVDADSTSRVAALYGVSQYDLLAANPGLSAGSIPAGTVIRI